EVLQKDRENAQALAGLAKCYIKTADLARAEQTLALVPPTKADSSPVASARAALELARKTPAAGDIETLRAKLAADPKDPQARFDLALALNAKGDRSGALDELLAVVAKNRGWNDDAARKQLLQFVYAWGPADPSTIARRPRRVARRRRQEPRLERRCSPQAATSIVRCLGTGRPFDHRGPPKALLT